MIIMEKLNKLIDQAFEEVKSKLSKDLVSKWLVIFIAIQPILDFYIFFETVINPLILYQKKRYLLIKKKINANIP